MNELRQEISDTLGEKYVELYDLAEPYLSGPKLHPDIKFDFHMTIRYAKEGRITTAEWWKGWMISGIKELEARKQ